MAASLLVSAVAWALLAGPAQESEEHVVGAADANPALLKAAPAWLPPGATLVELDAADADPDAGSAISGEVWNSASDSGAFIVKLQYSGANAFLDNLGQDLVPVQVGPITAMHSTSDRYSLGLQSLVTREGATTRMTIGRGVSIDDMISATDAAEVTGFDLLYSGDLETAIRLVSSEGDTNARYRLDETGSTAISVNMIDDDRFALESYSWLASGEHGPRALAGIVVAPMHSLITVSNDGLVVRVTALGATPETLERVATSVAEVSGTEWDHLRASVEPVVEGDFGVTEFDDGG